MNIDTGIIMVLSFIAFILTSFIVLLIIERKAKKHEKIDRDEHFEEQQEKLINFEEVKRRLKK